MKYFIIALCAVVAYLLGSINTAIILSGIKGKDIRKEGSGNAGATNTLRVMGKKAAALVALFDGLKGVVAILVAKLICNLAGIEGADRNTGVYLGALFVMLGHIYPVYFGFKGGKGVMILFASCIIIMLTTKYVSLGSCIGAAAFPILVAVLHTDDTLFIVISALIGVLAIFKHRSNIVRLVKGTESKLNFKK